ncbi:MAG: CCA tRNA nucleotidyltransferase [Candidatus Omnitrophota bacterium]
MREYLNRLPDEIQELIGLARDLAEHMNIRAYFVGGFVRDLILGANNLDLDIVIEGDGIAFAQELAKILRSKLICHRRFQTATVIIRPDLKIDVASARKEFYPSPAYLPVVRTASLKDDHFRRDFTINAMAISITGGNFGKLIDFFGGEIDLRNKRVRFLHDLSFVDDPTRILRAIRFEQRFNFKIEPRTLKYLKQAVRLKMLSKVEPQRIRDELVLLLKEERPIKQIRRMQELTGFDFITPALSLSKKTRKLLGSIEKIALSHGRIERWVIYFMGLIDSLNLKQTKKVCDKFAFGKQNAKKIISSKKINRKFILILDKKGLRPSRIYSLLSPLSYEVILLLKAKYNQGIIRQNIDDFLKTYRHLSLGVSGYDLQELGIRPGPDYQSILKKVFKAKLDGLAEDKDAQLRLIKKIVKLQ